MNLFKKKGDAGIARFGSEEKDHGPRVGSPLAHQDSSFGQNPFVKNDLAWRRRSTEMSKGIAKEPPASVRQPVPVRSTGSPEGRGSPETIASSSLDSSAKRNHLALVTYVASRASIHRLFNEFIYFSVMMVLI